VHYHLAKKLPPTLAGNQTRASWVSPMTAEDKKLLSTEFLALSYKQNLLRVLIAKN